MHNFLPTWQFRSGYTSSAILIAYYQTAFQRHWTLLEYTTKPRDGAGLAKSLNIVFSYPGIRMVMEVYEALE
jgi:hypothetical protein